MDDRPLAVAVSVGHLLALLLYGVYSAAFSASIFYLVKKCHASRTTMTKLIVLANVLMFLLATAQMAIILKTALLPVMGSFPDASTATLLAISPFDATNISKIALLQVQVSVANSLLVYRVWMVCQRKWSIIIVPTCCLVGFIVCSSLFLKIASVPQNIEKAPIQLLPFGSALAAQLAALACDVVTNTYCTAFLSYKIWQSQRLVRHATPYFRSFSSSNVMAILIESAALYTACIIALFVAFARQSISNYVITDLCPSIAGIAYCLIIIRFGMGGAFKSNPQLLSSIPSEGRTFQHPDNMAMHHVMVHMEQYTETDGSSTGRRIRDSSDAKIERDDVMRA